METRSSSFQQLAAAARQLVRRLVTIAENRIELVTLEVQEGRERLLHVLFLALAVAALVLLAGITLTAAMVIWLWPISPGAVLLVLAGVYGSTGGWLGWRLTQRLRDWQTLPATLDQLKKDRAALEQICK
ncbi:MAG TPA: phage holin family protein [Dongiaceae bacterium]|nr:phage holin family protein [Dongiaceae bacterium]